MAALSTTFKISLYITYVGNCFLLLPIDDYAILLLAKNVNFKRLYKAFFPKIEATNFNKTRVVTTLRDNVESIRFFPVNENVSF